MNSYDVVVLPLTRDQFIQTGGNVHMVCRSKQRGEEALEEIKKESGNDVCCLLLQKRKNQNCCLYKNGLDTFATHDTDSAWRR